LASVTELLAVLNAEVPVRTVKLTVEDQQLSRS